MFGWLIGINVSLWGLHLLQSCTEVTHALLTCRGSASKNQDFTTIPSLNPRKMLQPSFQFWRNTTHVVNVRDKEKVLAAQKGHFSSSQSLYLLFHLSNLRKSRLITSQVWNQAFLSGSRTTREAKELAVHLCLSSQSVSPVPARPCEVQTNPNFIDHHSSSAPPYTRIHI